MNWSRRSAYVVLDYPNGLQEKFINESSIDMLRIVTTP